MSDLFTRRALSLTSGTPDVTGTITLDPQTEWIEVAIDRPTTGGSGITWASGTQIGVSIQVLLDGQLYEATGRSSGGIRSANGSEIAAYKLRWNLPCGYLGGSTGKRLGETRQSTFQVRIRFELLRGTTLTSSVVVTSASSALTLPERHNSVAYDSAASAIEESGDGVLSFSITSTGSDRAALVAVGSRGTSLAGTLAITGGGETISGTLWDVVDGGVSVNSRGYSIVNQATGAQTLTSDLTATSTTDHFLGIVTMTGVNQSSPTGNTSAAAPAFTSSPVSCTVTGMTAADLVVDFLMIQAAPTVGANQTERVNPANTSFPTYYRLSTQDGADGGAMSWTHATDTTRALNAVVFKAQASAAVTGTATASITESDVVAGGKTVIVTLTDDTYVAASAVQTISNPTTASGGTTTTTSFTITLPTTQSGDLMILEFTHRGTGDGSFSGTYGGTFTKKFEQSYNGSTFSGLVYYSRATGNHSGETVIVSSLTNSCAGILTVYRNVVASGDPFDNAATAVGEENASGNETQAQITTLVDGAMVCLTVFNSPDVAVSTQACTTPGALTERVEVLSTGGTDTSVSHASAIRTSAGATGAFTWAQTDGAGGSIAYALEPIVTTPFADARAAMRDGVDSAQSEGTGWDALKSTLMPVANVVRTSDTVCTITLAAAGSYNITAQETITVTVPSSILSGAAAIVATPTFTVDTSGGGPTPRFNHGLLLGVN